MKADITISKPNTFWDFLNRDIQVFGHRIGDKQKERFYNLLVILMESGIDIKTALELVVDEQQKPKKKALFEELKDMVITGDSLSSAMNKTKKFSDYEIYSIQIGEESGRLNAVLNQLCKYYQNKVKQKRQVIQALSYPVVVMITAFGAVFFMLQFIVPVFADIFKRTGEELPYVTSLVIDLAEYSGRYFGIAFIILLMLVFTTVTQRKKSWYRRFTSYMVLRVPIFGEMLRKVYLARFCSSMALLTSSKVSIIRAIKLVKKMVRFYPIEQSLEKIEKDILDGGSFHDSMKQFSIYDKRLTSLIRIGEEVNQLDTVLEKAANQYSADVEHQTSLISSLIEPILIVFLALVVGLILIAMYLPLFQLGMGIE